MIPSLRNFPYETRLQNLGLWTLENRRVRADLVEVYKITHGLSSVSFSTFFEMSTYDRTCGHSLKLNKSRVRTATKLVFTVKKLCYEERLRKLKLPTLKYSRIRGDKKKVKKLAHLIIDLLV